MIETNRLIIRALTLDEAEAIVAGDRSQRSWAPEYPTTGDVMVATAALENRYSFAAVAMPWGLFTIVEKSSGLSIGGIGFKGSPNERGEVEIGYGIAHSYQNQGLASEAVAALCDFARRGARFVIAETDRDNLASQRLLEKCGFNCDAATPEFSRWSRATID